MSIRTALAEIHREIAGKYGISMNVDIYAHDNSTYQNALTVAAGVQKDIGGNIEPGSNDGTYWISVRTEFERVFTIFYKPEDK